MADFIKGKLLIGPIVAIVGSVMLLSGGIIGLLIPEVQFTLIYFPILYLTFVLPIVLGAVSIVGASLAIVNRKSGNLIAIIGGLIAIIGMFIPILVVYPLVMSFFYIDPFLILIGGIIGIVIRE